MRKCRLETIYLGPIEYHVWMEPVGETDWEVGDFRRAGRSPMQPASIHHDGLVKEILEKFNAGVDRGR